MYVREIRVEKQKEQEKQEQMKILEGKTYEWKKRKSREKILETFEK